MKLEGIHFGADRTRYLRHSMNTVDGLRPITVRHLNLKREPQGLLTRALRR